MHDEWEYRVDKEMPDLAGAGRDGWELVAVVEAGWVFKRPAPSAAERFTLDQRTAALSKPTDVPAPTRHLLHPEIAALIRRVNHTQMLLIADRGFPIPPIPTVDLALLSDVPTVPQVLEAILPDLPADRLIVADEQTIASHERFRLHQEGSLPVETMAHLRFKRLAASAVGCIRTGDSVPYANVLVVGG